MIFKYLSLCLIGISACFFPSTVAREAMLNGDVSGIDQFPYHVAVILRGSGFRCGGGIIGEQFVLTAAHCVVGKDGRIIKKRWHILAGTNDLLRLSQPAVIAPVKKIFVPKKFVSKYLGGSADIAVLMLKEPLTLSQHIKKLDLPLPKHEYLIGKAAVITGFGRDQIETQRNKVLNSSSTDRQLRFDVAHILHYCMQNHVKHRVPDKQLCAKIVQRDFSEPRGTCQGDSGGPLVIKNTIVGILSIGLKTCKEIESGSVYTRVSRYLDIIEHAVHDKPSKDIVAEEVPH